MRKLRVASGRGYYSDPLELWEAYVADISHSLMIKYGLRGGPSEALVQLWLQRVRANIAAGMSQEAAGEAAAKVTFTDFRTHFYASQAETLEALLKAAGNK